MYKRCWNGKGNHSEIHGEQTRYKLSSWKLVHHFDFDCVLKESLTMKGNQIVSKYCKRKQVLRREFAATVVGYISECQR